jgi:hypothetical protein
MAELLDDGSIIGAGKGFQNPGRGRGGEVSRAYVIFHSDELPA